MKQIKEESEHLLVSPFLAKIATFKCFFFFIYQLCVCVCVCVFIRPNLFIKANLKIDVTHRHEYILTPLLRFDNAPYPADINASSPLILFRSLFQFRCLRFIIFFISVNKHDVGIPFWVSAHFHFLDLRRREKREGERRTTPRTN